MISNQFLLDTHVFIWWLVGDARLPRKARDSTSNLDHDIFISSASAWEISIKFHLANFQVLKILQTIFLAVLSNRDLRN